MPRNIPGVPSRRLAPYAAAIALFVSTACHRPLVSQDVSAANLPYGYMPPWWHTPDAECDPHWQPPIDLASGITQPVGTIAVDRSNPGIISGVITARDNKPLRNALVQIPSPYMAVGTDSLGAFRLKKLPAGRYQLRARAIGYERRTDTIEVTATSGSRVRLPLDRDINRSSHWCGGQIAGVSVPPPARPDSLTTQRWAWYLHGETVETQRPPVTEPGGAAHEYRRILSMLSDSGFRVVSELRKPNTDLELYADSVAQQIRRRLAAGVPAANISVLGYDTGALIAMLVSARLPERNIRYVAIDGCSASSLARFPLQFHGDVLSIFERGDTLGGSCAPVFRQSVEMGYRREIMLQTGLGHANGYYPLAEWLAPAAQWARSGGSGDARALAEPVPYPAMSLADKPYAYLPKSVGDLRDRECGARQPAIDIDSRITKPVGRFVADTVAPGIISGTITTRDNTPLPGANVVVSPGDISVGTDSAGFFHIKRLPAGRYLLRIRAIGYVPRTDTADVTTTAGTRLRLPVSYDGNKLTDGCGFGPMIWSHAPSNALASGHWLFFLHDEAVENITRGYWDVSFGEYDYDRITRMIVDSGFRVVSEARKHGTDPSLYADSVAKQIGRLLANGVPAKDIAVLGDSKGALIAMLVATRVANKDIRYAVLGGCSKANLAGFPLEFHGNVLSIYEYGDTLGGSCAAVFRRSKDMGNRKEVMLESDLGHRAFLHPLTEWLGPSLAWVRAGR